MGWKSRDTLKALRAEYEAETRALKSRIAEVETTAEACRVLTTDLLGLLPTAQLATLLAYWEGVSCREHQRHIHRQLAAMVAMLRAAQEPEAPAAAP